MASEIDKDTGHYSKIDLSQAGAFGTSTLDFTQKPSDTKMAAFEMPDSKELMELKDIIKDILSGDPEAAKNEKYRYLNFNQIKTAIEWLMTNNFDESLQSLLLTNPWLLTFKNKPPTADEFLTHKYIGSMADSVWLPVRKMFMEYFDPLKPYRNAILNPSIGSGKALPIDEKVLVGYYNKKPVYKEVKDFKIGDSVWTPFGDCAKILSIQKLKKSKIVKINLTNGTSIRTAENHYNTVCFRTENGQKIFDTVTSKYIFDNLDKYNFEFPTLKTFNEKDLSFYKVLKELPSHEYAPADKIIPIMQLDKNKVYISSIEYVEDEEAWCFTLNDPIGLYVVENGIITHNSTFTMLALLYIAASFSLMRDPWKFFNKSKTTIFAICLCAVTLTKAKEIYEEPIRQLIESADFWRFCRTHKEMLDAEAELAASDTVEYIPWANGGPQPLDSKVYLPDGSYKLMKDVKVGDIIASPTTKYCEVIDIPYESDNDICYEITLDDGRTCRCAANHKWKVAWQKDNNGDWIWEVVSIEFIINHPELDFEIFEGKFTDEIRTLHLSKEH